jgi:hypothetical protein
MRPDIEVTITGVRIAPSWETVDHLLRTALDQGAPPDGAKWDDETINAGRLPNSYGYGQLTRIKRDDGGSNYRGLGDYTLTFSSDRDGDVVVHLRVQS